jgi:hypothetical protein
MQKTGGEKRPGPSSQRGRGAGRGTDRRGGGAGRGGGEREVVKEPKSNAREEHRQRDRRDGTGRCVVVVL